MSSIASKARSFFKIEHPASRLADPDTISVAGFSSKAPTSRATELVRLAEGLVREDFCMVLYLNVSVSKV